MLLRPLVSVVRVERIASQQYRTPLVVRQFVPFQSLADIGLDLGPVDKKLLEVCDCVVSANDEFDSDMWPLCGGDDRRQYEA